MGQVVGSELAATAGAANKSAGGLDNWLPAEIGLLSDAYFDVLADTFNLVEAGAPWPSGMHHSKAMFSPLP